MQDDMDLIMETNLRTTAHREKLANFLNSVINVPEKQAGESFVEECRCITVSIGFVGMLIHSF